jgi:PTS system galactitol-specific IIA component
MRPAGAGPEEASPPDRGTVLLDEDLVLVGLQAADREAVIQRLAERLAACGAVEPEYAAAACQREAEFPTGLPTAGVHVAIPHADATHVNRAAVALATCHPPVPFRNMADPEQELPVELVVMAVVPSSEEQVRMLQRLADAFGEPEALLAMRDATEPKQLLQLFEHHVIRRDSDPTGGA